MADVLAKLACLVLMAVTVGCGGNDGGLVPVSGTVTFDGGPPPAGGFLSFVPIERVAGKTSRPARATFQTDGTYVATSFEEGDGVLPGKYTVAVTCNSGPVDYSKKDPFNAASYVPKDYQGEQLVVEEGSDAITLNIDVPLKK
jgi:hypothetical protein